VSPVAKCFTRSLPSTLDGCIIRAHETQQERMLFGILLMAGVLLTGPGEESYPRVNFRLQRKRSAQEVKRRGLKRETHRTFNSD
jgi:hypothetical protein